MFLLLPPFPFVSPRVTPRRRGRVGFDWPGGQWGSIAAAGLQQHMGSSVGGLSINSARRATTAGRLRRAPSDGPLASLQCYGGDGEISFSVASGFLLCFLGTHELATVEVVRCGWGDKVIAYISCNSNRSCEVRLGRREYVDAHAAASIEKNVESDSQDIESTNGVIHPTSGLLICEQGTPADHSISFSSGFAVVLLGRMVTTGTICHSPPLNCGVCWSASHFLSEDGGACFYLCCSYIARLFKHLVISTVK
ncbi:hypothetical protein Taro_012748 [Colocasia esculenta]|uniref:Uncharacterized protein n=1 Tax=Colocasia esculenta TaxID=4460 RepID=A0A843UEE2_COLES|nr:hypothetical protein [Colocasia esculenta]